MRFDKGRHTRSIKEPLFQLLEADVRVGRIHHALKIVSGDAIDTLLRTQRRDGTPTHLSLESLRCVVSVYPVPDRRYDITVTGTRIVKF